ncbi:iron-regulated transporter [Aaosphaeria arxii CBS 175.79]|uniref:Solute carrier family 40 member n=1 Tax=Aaosphaeria arxii CBS 175.79 TaxID=1450172 RepID=A0A6A5XWD8_9PLEO|nr:iron-regulated transporter [Aaosphaeria arxii CBS 175.79]KAF2017482.1 iron-regulated transporter [Aaosphaeria arxii CBS 175.79]
MSLQVDEETPLIRKDSTITSDLNHVPSSIKKRLYISHFLSTWNSRVFEFGAVLYLASIFPNSLRPMSIYAFTRGIASILLSPAVGRYIDTANRLQVVRSSIVFQRVSVALSCLIFWVFASGRVEAYGLTVGLLTIVAMLACTEKICSVMNTVSVEKDWVVVVAGKNEAALRELNAQMRRIDLICKLAGPFMISMTDGFSTEIAIILNFSMNIASVVIEYYAIARVYESVPALQEPKTSTHDQQIETGSTSYAQRTTRSIKSYVDLLSTYFHHRAFLPSFALAILNFTVLSFGGQMVTYLLSGGYNSHHIGFVRTLAVVLEIAATWTAPWFMSKVGPLRAGLWSINWQILSLAGAATAFLSIKYRPYAASGLVAGSILSRIGLRGFDLCAQIVVQEEVEAEIRGAFSAVEASFQSLFEMCSYFSTMVFARPDQFEWPVLLSCGAVFMAGVLYSRFVRSRRGHLLHLPSCVHPKGRGKHPVHDEENQSPLRG